MSLTHDESVQCTECLQHLEPEDTILDAFGPLCPICCRTCYGELAPLTASALTTDFSHLSVEELMQRLRASIGGTDVG